MFAVFSPAIPIYRSNLMKYVLGIRPVELLICCDEYELHPRDPFKQIILIFVTLRCLERKKREKINGKFCCNDHQEASFFQQRKDFLSLNLLLFATFCLLSRGLQTMCFSNRAACLPEDFFTGGSWRLFLAESCD